MQPSSGHDSESDADGPRVEIVSSSDPDEDEDEPDADQVVSVKAVETVSAIDLIMGEDEDRDESPEGDEGHSPRPTPRVRPPLVGGARSPILRRRRTALRRFLRTGTSIRRNLDFGTLIGTAENPLRVAIVGSGPSGFYAAGHLLNAKKLPDLNAQVDMFDRLPTPWGLVRGGVAPDHPNIKAVSRVYEKTAAHPEFRFFGNVEFGEDITHEDLVERYHAVIYAVGAQTDKRMGIPGEDLPGSWAATEFVAWYNGHPDYRDLEFDLSCERAVVIGNGNVAADVARMLALTREELAGTDVADHAIDVLADSGIKEIVVLGRRGPAQAAFTNPSCSSSGEMTDADVFVDPRDVEIDPLSHEWLEGDEAHDTSRKNVDILSGYSTREPAGKRRRIVLRFLVSPVEILGDERVEGIRICRNELHRDEDGSLRACATDATEDDRGRDRVPLDRLQGRAAARACRSTSAAARSPTSSAASRARRRPASTWSAGSSAAPPGSSAPTSATPQETVDTGRGPGGGPPARAVRPRPRLARGAARRAQARARDLRGLGGDRQPEREAGEPHGRPRVKLTRFEELLEAARERVSS